jgi:flavin reductase (DIM6/NTAB) family NADH-FMN oxidoreductase RutF
MRPRVGLRADVSSGDRDPNDATLGTFNGLFGNCHGPYADKFERFGLTPRPATRVAAPLIAECYANFECRLHDAGMVRTHGLFIWEVVRAHVATSPKRLQTIHYRGNGEFMISGGTISRRRMFRPENL